jgi:hypothetical protein
VKISLRIAPMILASALLAAPLLTQADEAMPGSLLHLIASARTKADQERIAGIYEAQAIRDREEAAKHRALANYYRGRESRASRSNGGYLMEPHCTSIAEYYTKAADESEKLAEMHRSMAAEMK